MIYVFIFMCREGMVFCFNLDLFDLGRVFVFFVVFCVRVREGVRFCLFVVYRGGFCEGFRR